MSYELRFVLRENSGTKHSHGTEKIGSTLNMVRPRLMQLGRYF